MEQDCYHKKPSVQVASQVPNYNFNNLGKYKPLRKPQSLLQTHSSALPQFKKWKYVNGITYENEWKNVKFSFILSFILLPTKYYLRKHI